MKFPFGFETTNENTDIKYQEIIKTCKTLDPNKSKILEKRK